MGEGFPFVLVLIISLLSAWVSGFNCWWLFIPNAKSANIEMPVFYILLSFALVIANYFIWHHFNIKLKKELKGENSVMKQDELKSKRRLNFWLSLSVQTLSFFFIATYFSWKLV